MVRSSLFVLLGLVARLSAADEQFTLASTANRTDHQTGQVLALGKDFWLQRDCNQIKGGMARRRCFHRQHHAAGEDVMSSEDALSSADRNDSITSPQPNRKQSKMKKRRKKANNGANAAQNDDQVISVARLPAANGKRPKRILVTCLQASGCSLFIVLLGQVCRRSEVTALRMV
jgi:hypothetical protein